MKLALCFAAMALLALATPLSAADEKSPLDFTLTGIDGKPVDLSTYKGQVVLMVNVASRCGYTPQYKQLEEVYTKYKPQGFTVMGFPANDFLSQEPGTNEQIQEFCTKNYGVDFPIFSKITVKNNKDQAPLYKFLTAPETNPGMSGAITWNFEKFLVGRDGKVVKRFPPATKPDNAQVIAAIEAELAKKK